MIESPSKWLTAVPPDAESEVPTRIICPVFAWMVRIADVESMANSIREPWGGDAGNVAVAVPMMK